MGFSAENLFPAEKSDIKVMGFFEKTPNSQLSYRPYMVNSHGCTEKKVRGVWCGVWGLRSLSLSKGACLKELSSGYDYSSCPEFCFATDAQMGPQITRIFTNGFLMKIGVQWPRD
jgi:hypothetical protein